MWLRFFHVVCDTVCHPLETFNLQLLSGIAQRLPFIHWQHRSIWRPANKINNNAVWTNRRLHEWDGPRYRCISWINSRVERPLFYSLCQNCSATDIVFTVLSSDKNTISSANHVYHTICLCIWLWLWHSVILLRYVCFFSASAYTLHDSSGN